jgi:hypothetical protein
MLNLPVSLPLIHFSDGSLFVIGEDKNWIWYRRGEENSSATVAQTKFPPSLMVFAVIGIRYKSKSLVVEGPIDTDKYIENMENLNFIRDLDQKYTPFEWVYQQDGARSHTSGVSIEWLEERWDLLVDWFANSPDLSPIELLWSLLK